MRFLRPMAEMTTADFNAALREAGFGVANGRIVDVSGKCRGFAAVPSFRKGELGGRPVRGRVPTPLFGGRDVRIDTAPIKRVLTAHLARRWLRPPAPTRGRSLYSPPAAAACSSNGPRPAR